VLIPLSAAEEWNRGYGAAEEAARPAQLFSHTDAWDRMADIEFTLMEEM
jgi:hypothetical protein